MGIEAIQGAGAGRARVVCDECTREEIVPADYAHGSGGVREINSGKVKNKLLDLLNSIRLNYLLKYFNIINLHCIFCKCWVYCTT